MLPSDLKKAKQIVHKCFKEGKCSDDIILVLKEAGYTENQIVHILEGEDLTS